MTTRSKFFEELSSKFSQNDLIMYIETVKNTGKKIGRTIIELLDMKISRHEIEKCFEIKAAVGDKFILQ